MSRQVLGVIPARIGSTRLPQKPLRLIGGKTLLERVWTCASGCRALDRLVIATDSPEIYSLAKSFGADVIMSDPELPSGSARTVAAAETLSGDGSIDESFSLLVNIQGDMPFVPASVIDQLVTQGLDDELIEFSLFTVAVPIRDVEQWRRSDVVKVVLGLDRRALYFSRAPIPAWRDSLPADSQVDPLGLQHLGLYAFRPGLGPLLKASDWTYLESAEKLEQLRVLERGHLVFVLEISEQNRELFHEVNVIEDIVQAEDLIKRLNL